MITEVHIPTVAEIMTRNVFTLAPSTPIREAMRLCRRKHRASAPVTDASGTVLGMFTEYDLIQTMAAAAFHQEPGGVVSDHMTTEPITIDKHTDLLSLVKLFRERPHPRFPVVDNGRLVGLVSRYDLIGALDQLAKKGEKRPGNPLYDDIPV